MCIYIKVDQVSQVYYYCQLITQEDEAFESFGVHSWPSTMWLQIWRISSHIQSSHHAAFGQGTVSERTARARSRKGDFDFKHVRLECSYEVYNDRLQWLVESVEDDTAIGLMRPNNALAQWMWWRI